MTPSQLNQSKNYNGTYLGLPFSIVHWGVERGEFPGRNNGKGCWNYYVHFYESQIENFDALWKPNTGMVVCQGNLGRRSDQVGTIGNDWKAEESLIFSPFTGTVTLSND